MSAPVAITLFRKKGGPLTKRIRLDSNGHIISDGSECRMSAGTAERMRLDDIAALGKVIEGLQPSEAIALGALAPDLPDQVEVVTKHKFAAINGMPRPDLIARSREAIFYIPDRPVFVLLDHDPKGMPAEIAQWMKANRGFWRTMVLVFPQLQTIARLGRRSTSAGIARKDTGEQFAGSGGVHLYLVIKDGADAIRFLTTLHERLWLAGYGWCVVSKSGQLLERSIVDRMVGAPERLVFEGAPVLEPPLEQDRSQRRPDVRNGDVLDTVALFPQLTNVERAKFRELKAKAARLLKREADEARQKFVAAQVKRLVDRLGLDPMWAAEIVNKQCDGILFPQIELPFDDDDLAGATVADVLADPAKFEGATLADPVEGVDYGRGKAIVMRHADGTPWIHSFAHGRTIYELRHDAEAVRGAIEKAAKADVADTYVRYMLSAHVRADEGQALLDLAAKLSDIGKRAIAQRLNAALGERHNRRAQALRQQRLAERTDPRPQLKVPAADAEFLPVMADLNEVLAASKASEPPMRDTRGCLVQVRNRRVPYMHELTALGVNAPQPQDTRLPAPEQPLIEQLNDIRAAELVERYIEYVDEDGRPVHLPGVFVQHYLQRDDAALPQLHSVVTQPVMLPDGTLLSGRGLNRKYHILFRVPDELEALLPTLSGCGERQVAEAMQFLADDWLCDVACSYIGKCIIISAALSIIERTLLSERPVYGVAAGRRGSGKTTTLIMLLVAVTGLRPAAAAWSTNEEERRKALMAFLLAGVSAIIWDNITRGSQLNCPHIEKSCTTAIAADRKLGVSEMVEALASVIHFFTGNNIGFKGDLSSRGLMARMEVERADPENRNFQHPDPIGWTLANRGRILRAFYTLLLGNPKRENTQAETRFKEWWRLCGAAVENGAKQHIACVPMDDWLDGCPPVEFSFKDQFLDQEDEEEESASLADALEALLVKWPAPQGKQDGGEFKAAEVANFLNETVDPNESAAITQARGTLRAFLFPKLSSQRSVSAPEVSSRLRLYRANPVKLGGKTLVLICAPGGHTNVLSFHVRSR
jgi:hypothetical protein